MEENIGMLKKSPKDYYKGVFREIVAEIKENRYNLIKIQSSPIWDRTWKLKTERTLSIPD